MARGKGKWATQSTVDLGSIMQSLMYYGQISQRQEASDDAWQDKVATRLTGPNSAWSISPNEYDPKTIEDTIAGLEVQHQNYQNNNKIKYVPGEHGYDSTQKTIEDYKVQLKKSHNFRAEYNTILASNDASVEMRDVQQYNEAGEIMYFMNDEGGFRLDDNNNKIPFFKRQNDWTEMQDLIHNQSTIHELTGDVVFPARVHELQENILARSVSMKQKLFEFNRKYDDWLSLPEINSTMGMKLINFHNLIGEETRNLEMIDDVFGGNFILDSGYFERWKVAIDTDEFEDFDATNKQDIASRFKGRESLYSEIYKLESGYVKLHNYIYPEGRINAQGKREGGLAPAGVNEYGEQTYAYTFEDPSSGDKMVEAYTRKQLMKHYPAYKEINSQIEELYYQIERTGPVRHKIFIEEAEPVIWNPKFLDEAPSGDDKIPSPAETLHLDEDNQKLAIFIKEQFPSDVISQTLSGSDATTLDGLINVYGGSTGSLMSLFYDTARVMSKYEITKRENKKEEKKRIDKKEEKSAEVGESIFSPKFLEKYNEVDIAKIEKAWDDLSYNSRVIAGSPENWFNIQVNKYPKNASYILNRNLVKKTE